MSQLGGVSLLSMLMGQSQGDGSNLPAQSPASQQLLDQLRQRPRGAGLIPPDAGTPALVGQLPLRYPMPAPFQDAIAPQVLQSAATAAAPASPAPTPARSGSVPPVMKASQSPAGGAPSFSGMLLGTGSRAGTPAIGGIPAPTQAPAASAAPAGVPAAAAAGVAGGAVPPPNPQPVTPIGMQLAASGQKQMAPQTSGMQIGLGATTGVPQPLNSPTFEAALAAQRQGPAALVAPDMTRVAGPGGWTATASPGAITQPATLGGAFQPPGGFGVQEAIARLQQLMDPDYQMRILADKPNLENRLMAQQLTLRAAEPVLRALAEQRLGAGTMGELGIKQQAQDVSRQRNEWEMSPNRDLSAIARDVFKEKLAAGQVPTQDELAIGLQMASNTLRGLMAPGRGAATSGPQGGQPTAPPSDPNTTVIQHVMNTTSADQAFEKIVNALGPQYVRDNFATIRSRIETKFGTDSLKDAATTGRFMQLMSRVPLGSISTPISEGFGRLLGGRSGEWDRHALIRELLKQQQGQK